MSENAMMEIDDAFDLGAWASEQLAAAWEWLLDKASAAWEWVAAKTGEFVEAVEEKWSVLVELMTNRTIDRVVEVWFPKIMEWVCNMIVAGALGWAMRNFPVIREAMEFLNGLGGRASSARAEPWDYEPDGYRRYYGRREWRDRYDRYDRDERDERETRDPSDAHEPGRLF